MESVLIDQAGLAWSPSSPRIVKQVGRLVPANEIVDFAVSELGFIFVHHRGDAAAVFLRPDLTSPLATAAAASAVALAQPREVVLIIEPHRQVETFDTILAALRRLTALGRELSPRDKTGPAEVVSEPPELAAA